MMPEVQALIAELDSTLSKASSPKHLAILRSVTELFLNGAEHYSSEQVALFDDVFGRLIEDIAPAELIKLSASLAPVGNAPAKTVGCLALHADIAVAGPVLGKSNVLAEATLVEVAKGKPHSHLSAIAGRSKISEPVTDVLVDRGSPEIARKVLDNQDARLSELGFVKLLNRAAGDKALAAAIANRPDFPAELQPFLKLAMG
jgi:uncharacterized protein (DUF2336 family)